MIRVENLTKIYSSQSGSTIASDNINISFKDNGFYVILGKSGCGKTTLLNILSGIDSYDDGHIYTDNIGAQTKCDIGEFNSKQLDEYRNLKVGIIFQSYNLISEMNVYDNLRLVLELQEWENNDNREQYIDENIRNILKTVGLGGYEKRKISQLSGGEQQRVAIARILLKQPDIILADEPTGNLDIKTGTVILDLLKKISKDHLVIMVSHDRDSTFKYADEVICMEDGRVVDIINNKTGEYLYSFVINCDQKKERVENLSKHDMQKKISEYVEENESVSITDITKKTIPDKIETTTDEMVRNNTCTKKMRKKYSLHLSFSFLWQHKMRLFFTIVMLSFSMALMFVATYAGFYDKNEMIDKYLTENKTIMIPASTSSSYEDDFYEIHEDTYKKGKGFFELLSNKMVDDKVAIGRYLKEQFVVNKSIDEYADVTLFFLKDNCYPSLKSGNTTCGDSEIIISDYIAHVLSVKEGDTVTCSLLGECKIVGIAETDYVKNRLAEKLLRENTDEFFEYKCCMEYFAVYTSEKNLERCIKNNKTIEMQAANFTIKKRSEYFESYVKYNGVSNIEGLKLLKGRMPIKDDECVVSIEFAEESRISIDKFEELSYNFQDIHDTNYNGYYSYLMNMSGLFENGIKVVGICENNDSDDMADIIISDTIWDKLKNEYYNYYRCDYIICPKPDTDFYNMLVKSDNNKVSYNEPAIERIVDFDNTSKSIRPILFLILALIVGINVIMIGTFINISINENKQNIGILRALGVTMKDCIAIFDVEFIIIYVMSMLFGIGLVYIINNRVNDLYIEGLSSVEFDIVNVNLKILATVIMIELVVNRLSVKIPISKLNRKKTIECIRKNY